MNIHFDRVRNFVSKAKALINPGPRPHTLIRQMVAEQSQWNDLFSTKLIEVLDRVAALHEGEKQFRLECIDRIAAAEDLARRLRLELSEKLAALEEIRNPRPHQFWIWVCSLTALLLGLSALLISLRGFR
jgi:hypothetical protein